MSWLAYIFLPILLGALILWASLDTYLLTRREGKPNRGFKIWKQPLQETEFRFLTGLKRDLVQFEEFGFLIKLKRTNFMLVSGDQILIRHSQRSLLWPLDVVLYVNLSIHVPELEYRVSFPVFLLSFIFVTAFLFFSFSSYQEDGAFISFIWDAVTFFLIAKSLVTNAMNAKKFLVRQASDNPLQGEH